VGDSHGDWQWWDLLRPDHATCMLMDGLPGNLQPVVQPIDDWNTNRKLGLLFEGRVGKGKIMVCSMDLQTDIDQRPVARQLLHSLLTYMNSDDFAPVVAVPADGLRRLTKQP
jgi:hypothetical protein